MENVMVLNNFIELTNDEMMEVDGGVNWDRVFAGTAFFLATCAVVATAEVTVPLIGIAYVSSAVAGAYTGYGFATN